MTKGAFLQTLCKGLYVDQSGSLWQVRLPLSCILLMGIRVAVNRTGRPIIKTSWAGKSYLPKIQDFWINKNVLTSSARVIRFAGGSFSLDVLSYWSFLLAFHVLNPSCNIFILVSFLVSIASTFRKRPDALRMLCSRRVGVV